MRLKRYQTNWGICQDPKILILNRRCNGNAPQPESLARLLHIARSLVSYHLRSVNRLLRRLPLRRHPIKRYPVIIPILVVKRRVVLQGPVPRRRRRHGHQALLFWNVLDSLSPEALASCGPGHRGWQVRHGGGPIEYCRRVGLVVIHRKPLGNAGSDMSHERLQEGQAGADDADVGLDHAVRATLGTGIDEGKEEGTYHQMMLIDAVQVKSELLKPIGIITIRTMLGPRTLIGTASQHRSSF